MPDFRGISPKKIAEAQSVGVRRQAFELRLKPELRARIVREAQQRGLLGFLSGEGDSVRGVVEGPAGAIDAFFDACIVACAPDMPAVIDITNEEHGVLHAFHDADDADT